jgi:hypothetical protein
MLPTIQAHGFRKTAAMHMPRLGLNDDTISAALVTYVLLRVG